MITPTHTTKEASLPFIQHAHSLNEALSQSFNLLPLSIHLLDSIRVHSTIQVIKTVDDYLSKVVFAHRPLPQVSEEDKELILSVTSQLHKQLSERFNDSYRDYVNALEKRNQGAFWFNHSAPYWTT